MKKFNAPSWLASLALAIFFAACDKEQAAAPPSIELIEPMEGKLYEREVPISGWVRDESLHRLKIRIAKDADGGQVFNYSKHWHGRKEFYIEELFLPDSLSGETAFTLTIEVEDEDDLKTEKAVNFKVKPQ